MYIAESGANALICVSFMDLQLCTKQGIQRVIFIHLQNYNL